MNLQFALICLINNIKEESKTKEIFKKKLLTLFKTQELIGMIESENGFDNLLPDLTNAASCIPLCLICVVCGRIFT